MANPIPRIAPAPVEADSDTLFTHAVLAQVGLPRKPTKARTFARTSGRASILLEAGSLFDGVSFEEQPLPSGTRPRLVLLHVCTEAVKTRRPQIEVGSSVREFLRWLNIDTGGKSMGYFRREMKALAACRMTVGIPAEGGPETIDAKPISKFKAWTTNDDQQRTLWPGVLELSPAFFDSVLAHAVPLDPNAIAELQNNALALDVYTWLAHRLCRVRNNAGARLSWENLHQQFGSVEYRDLQDFRKRFLGGLKRAAAVYPAARVDIVRGGLLLKPSSPPIARKGVVVALPAFENGDFNQRKSNGATGATDAAPPMPPIGNGKITVRSETPRADTTNPEVSLRSGPADTKVLPRAAVLPQAPLISEDALAAVRSVAPGWDKYFLAARYTEWMKGREHPKNPDAAFLGWAKRFTKGKSP